jgi:hypothetical protein
MLASKRTLRRLKIHGDLKRRRIKSINSVLWLVYIPVLGQTPRARHQTVRTQNSAALQHGRTDESSLNWGPAVAALGTRLRIDHPVSCEKWIGYS